MNKNRNKRNQVRENSLMDALVKDLEWQGKVVGHSRSGADVTVSKTKVGFNITFRNGYQNKIGQYITFAIKENYLFFKCDRGGYSVCHTKESGNGYVKLNNPKLSLENFVGDYDMQYFEPLGLYYIVNEETNHE